MPAAIASAYVELLADVAKFGPQVESAVQSSMARVSGAVDTGTAHIESSFSAAAGRADVALAGVDGNGFQGVQAGASAAAAGLETSLSGAAGRADVTLSQVDGDGLSGVKTSAAEAGDALGDEMEQGARRAEGGIDNLVKSAVWAAASAKVIGFAKDSISAASDVAETTSKVGVLFGDAADGVVAFAETAAESFGISKLAALDAAGTFAIFGQSAGLTGTELAGFSERLIGLAADLASFNNTSPEEAIQAIGAALRGESEAIRRYGVMLNDASINQAALTAGIWDGEGAMTSQQRTLAISAAIFEQTTSAQGDFARTSDGLANSSKILAAQFEDLKAKIGTSLAPVMQTVIGVAGDLLDIFASLPKPVQVLAIVVPAVGFAFSSMSQALQGLGVSAGAANKALGAIGLVLTAGIAIYSAYSSAKQRATQQTNDFRNALDAEAQGQEGATDALLASTITGDKFLKQHDDMAVSVADLGKAIQGQTVPSVERVRQAYEDAQRGGASWDVVNMRLKDSLGVSASTAVNFLARVDELTAAHNRAVEAENAENAALSELQAAGDSAATATDGLTVAIEGGTDASGNASIATSEFEARLQASSQRAQENAAALEEQKAALEAAEEATQALITATLSMFNSELQLANQQDRTTDAIRDYEEKLFTLGGQTNLTTEEQRDLDAAARDVYSSALAQAGAAAKLAEDQAKASGATLTAAQSATIQRDSLQQVANSLAPGSPLRAQLQAYIDVLNNQIPRDINTKLTATATATLTVLVSGSGTSAVYRYAEGGIFDRATVGVFGEAGREAIIPVTRPGRAMQLMRESGLGEMWERARTSSGQSGGALVSIGHAVFQDATDADLVAQRVNVGLMARL